jgi:predicted MFS family arabinose efflux permease
MVGRLVSRSVNTVAEYISPLANAEFRKLFGAQVIALVGTGLATVALVLLAYDLAGGGAGVVLGKALAIKMVAYVVFAPVVGGIAYRLRRKPLLISLDLVRAVIVLAMPFATEVWHIYVLIFLLNAFSAGFKPVFQSTIPDIIVDEQQYTRALSYSRLAYDLENLLSPMLAVVALMLFSYSELFMANSVAFLISASLILVTRLPLAEHIDRLEGFWSDISFGVRAYLRTPRLRGMLTLYLGVACASAMIIVNTVVYVREQLGGSESDVALALAASGAGSMLAALTLPKILDFTTDRSVMLGGSVLMSVGLIAIYSGPGYSTVLPIWFVIGVGWSVVQTPAGRVVNRSSSVSDRTSYFSAQFALTHACWMCAYPIAGLLGAALGIGTTALLLGIAVGVFAVFGALIWPRDDPAFLEHSHTEMSHQHGHVHDQHHTHTHTHTTGDNPDVHSHEHQHQGIKHSHVYVIDGHHPLWPD